MKKKTEETSCGKASDQHMDSSLILVSNRLIERLAEYISREDVCVAAVERGNNMASGTLRRFANGETLHTRQSTVDKLWHVVSVALPAAPPPVRKKLDHDLVLEKYAEGMNVNQIAKEMERSRQAIYSVLKEHNIKTTVPASGVAAAMRKYCKKHNITVSSLCLANSVDSSFMYSKGMMHKKHADRIFEILNRRPNVEPIKETLSLNKVANLKSRGLTNEEVAEELGVHVATIQRAVVRLKEQGLAIQMSKLSK